jgi:hypothetical protein
MFLLYSKSQTKRLCFVAIVLITVLFLVNIVMIANGVWPLTKNSYWFINPNDQTNLYSAKEHSKEDKSSKYRQQDSQEHNGKATVEMIDMWQDDSVTDHKHPLPPEYKVVHIDFKGAPPKISFLRTLFPLIASAGANALLMEYEDMFPYHGTLRNLSAKNCYSKTDIKEINRIASQNKLEIIPLVQTFGHLEFVLKLEEFQHLRETADFPQEICPNHPEAMDLIREMLRQVIYQL